MVTKQPQFRLRKILPRSVDKTPSPSAAGLLHTSRRAQMSVQQMMSLPSVSSSL